MARQKHLYFMCDGRHKFFWSVINSKIRMPIPKVTKNWDYFYYYYCVKRVHIWSFSGPYFPTFGVNTERYGVSLRIQSECGKIRTRKTSNTDTFHTVHPFLHFCYQNVQIKVKLKRTLKKNLVEKRHCILSSINAVTSNYSFMPENYFKLHLCTTWLIKAIYAYRTYSVGMNWHFQMFHQLFYFTVAIVIL